ncbi:unnamed protein product [Amaranthus hypochondriacus]
MEDTYEEFFLDVDQLIEEEALVELDIDEYEENYELDHESDNESDNENVQQEHMDMEHQPTENGATTTTSRKHLDLQKKRKIVDALLVIMEDGKLRRGVMKELASHFSVHKSTITRVFADIKNQMTMGNTIDVRSKKFGRTGPKPKVYSDAFLQSVPLYLRQTERSYAGALKISHVTLHNLKKKGRIRTHTCSSKPALTSDHKIARMKWVLSQINPSTANEDPNFVCMNHVIHIDEKWFYLSPDKRRFYLLPGEEDPYMAQQSKRFKLKAMFMAVIGKPLYDIHGGLIHDGKYGIFPFTVQEVAKKSSKNRAAGTMVTKALQNVNRDVIRHMLLTKVIPAIQSKWPESLPKKCIIQWDNARPHQIPQDEEFKAATRANGFNIQLVFQPAQSPDLNVLDLGLFRSMQSLQYQSFPENLDELIAKVIDCYNTFNPQVNKYIWVTLQICMVKILKANGGNNYKIPHINKKKLENLGILPGIVTVRNQIVVDAVEYLDSMFRPTTQLQGSQFVAEDTEVDAD